MSNMWGLPTHLEQPRQESAQAQELGSFIFGAFKTPVAVGRPPDPGENICPYRFIVPQEVTEVEGEGQFSLNVPLALVRHHHQRT
jgi:hypothetical protein